MTEMNEIDRKISEALARGETACPEGVPAAKWEMSKAMYLSSLQSHAQAAAQAAQAPTPSTAVAPVPAANMMTSAPASYSAPKSFDIDEVSQTGLSSVDGYIKLSAGQTCIGDDPISNPSFKVKITLSEVIKKLSIRINQPVKYYSTYDGINSTEGTPWMQVIQEVQRVDASARHYTSYEIPMLLCEPLVHMTLVNGAPVTNTVMEAGKVLGYTTSVTARKPFEEVLLELTRRGLKPSECEVTLNVKREDKFKNSQKWAILTYEILDVKNTADVE